MTAETIETVLGVYCAICAGALTIFMVAATVSVSKAAARSRKRGREKPRVEHWN